jgi:CRISPR-associated protein Csx10
MNGETATTFLPYTLTLWSPAIVTALAGDPNSAATQPFIPGGAVRGAVAARLLADGIAGDSAIFRDIVLSGAVRYLHAYPQIQGARALPAPLSWVSPKDDLDRARDLAAFSGRVTERDDAEDLVGLWPKESLVSLGAPFVAASASSGKREVVTPRVNARLHQQRDRVKGRPWLDRKNGQEIPQGAIFAYEYLEPEQVFRGLIQVMPEAIGHIERIKALFSQPILVGRSRRAGYGGDAEFTFAQGAIREYEGVSGSLARDIHGGECFRMMLVSTYVGRYLSTGQIDPAALEHEIRKRLGVTVERRCWAFEAVGSFNRKWRLEVPQAWAVAAGAVLVLRTDKSIPRSTLQEVECEGLGERRVEGFGRVLFVEHSEDTDPISLSRGSEEAVGQRATATPSEGMKDSVRNQLDFLEQRIMLSAARSEIDRLAADIATRAEKIPTSSLLGRIRTIFRAVHDEATACQALEMLATWCSGSGADALKPEATRKLQGCRIRGEDLLRWLKGVPDGKSSDDEWNRLVKAVDNASSLTGLAQSRHLTTEADADGILRRHSAVLRVHLIDAVLATLARRNRGGTR